MRQLPPAQRKIVEFLCLAGKPTTIKNISTPCLMSHQTAAKQIGELVTAGFVNRMRSGRNTFCELSEPLMRICIEVKDNKTQHFRLFVEFLRHWFSARELERRHAAFQHDGHTALLDRIHVEEAVRCSLADRLEPFVDALRDEAERYWDADDYKSLATIQQTLARESGSGHDYGIWVLALVHAGDTRSAIGVGREAAAKCLDDPSLQYWLTHAYCMEERFTEALTAIDRAIALGGNEPGSLCLRADVLLGLGRFEEAIQDAQAVLDIEPYHWHSFKQMLNAAVCMNRPEDADAYARDLVRLAPTEPGALFAAAEYYLSQDRLNQALELVEKVLDIDADDKQARRLRGFVLLRMEDYARAAEDLRQSASHHPNSVSTHCWLADSLLFAGDWEEAIGVAEHLIEIDPEHFHAHCVRGSALIKLGRPADAVAVLDELLHTNHCHSLLIAASEVRGIGDYRSAGRYLDRVAELQPDNRELWIERTRIHIDERAFDAAAESAARLEALPGGSPLGQLLAAQAAAATEPLPVSLDTLGAVLERDDFEREEEQHLEAIVGILNVSVLNFGPRYLPEGLANLRGLLAERLDEGVVGRILTDFLKANESDGLAGSLSDWETALKSLASSLADLPDCRIPLEMLQAAVRYSKTGDEKHLLSLPLEQRQLLEDVPPPVSCEHDGRV